MEIKQMKRKKTFLIAKEQKIFQKRLRFEVLPAQTNGVERESSFMNVHLDCIISNRKRINKLSTFPPPWKLSADAHGYTDVDVILGS